MDDMALGAAKFWDEHNTEDIENPVNERRDEHLASKVPKPCKYVGLLLKTPLGNG